MSQIHTGITDQMRSLLEQNDIDVSRTTRCSITHDAKGGVTEITVTLLAKKQHDKEPDLEHMHDEVT